MIALALVLAAGAALIAAIAFAPALRRRRRDRIRTQGFPGKWERILIRTVPIYARLPADLRARLQGQMLVFLAEKEFIGCAGLAITDEIRLTIAAQACLLIVNRDADDYSDLRAVLVYPSAFVARHEHRDEAGVHTLEDKFLAGESWDQGKVILAWEDVRYGAGDYADGDNVVYHEFAHQLDQAAGDANGTPQLAGPAAYARWARVFGREYERLRRQIRRGEATLIPQDAAENPGEFFAVATEVFFELPRDLRREHSELYAELRSYYRLDPAEWTAASG